MNIVNARVPDDKRGKLKVIASLEPRSLGETLTELVDGYIERHREAPDLLSRPGWAQAIVKGKGLDELGG